MFQCHKICNLGSGELHDTIGQYWNDFSAIAANMSRLCVEVLHRSSYFKLEL